MPEKRARGGILPKLGGMGGITRELVYFLSIAQTSGGRVRALCRYLVLVYARELILTPPPTGQITRIPAHVADLH